LLSARTVHFGDAPHVDESSEWTLSGQLVHSEEIFARAAGLATMRAMMVVVMAVMVVARMMPTPVPMPVPVRGVLCHERTVAFGNASHEFARSVLQLRKSLLQPLRLGWTLAVVVAKLLVARFRARLTHCSAAARSHECHARAHQVEFDFEFLDLETTERSLPALIRSHFAESSSRRGWSHAKVWWTSVLHVVHGVRRKRRGMRGRGQSPLWKVTMVVTMTMVVVHRSRTVTVMVTMAVAVPVVAVVMRASRTMHASPRTVGSVLRVISVELSVHC